MHEITKKILFIIIGVIFLCDKTEILNRRNLDGQCNKE